MRQYLEVKRQHRDAIVCFRMGDFFELFYEDALVASRVLELTLTSRAKDANGKPFCARKCAARCAASATRVEPMMLRREDGRGRLVWFLVFFVPVPAPPEGDEA